VAPGTRERLRVDGRAREYLLHRPTTDGGRSRPLVIAFHGRGADAAHLREQSRLHEAAGARGMLVAYPEGLHEGWAAGTAVTERRPDPDADVRFTEALIGELVRTERADPERVYVVGFSMGGSMALRVAAQRPDLLAGAASVSGQLPTGSAEVRPTGPVPVMIVYGAEDPVRPLAGLPDPAPAPAGEEPVTPTVSARAGAAMFAAAGGAADPVTHPGTGYDRTVWRLTASGATASEATASTTAAPGATAPSAPPGSAPPGSAPPGSAPPGSAPPAPASAASAATVELLVVHGAGHTWPGSRITAPEGFGRTSTALDATETVLGFFAPRSPAPGGSG
jgi:polyhydroxybutyrate depolymerase